ncbi:MAG: sulfatase-like hydrolase/transferase [Verrucomicrobiota bacterium]
MRSHFRTPTLTRLLTLLLATVALLALPDRTQAAEKKPNVVMLMQDDTGWFDFGCYGGGAALGHPTPNIDRMAREGARFTSWYGQASCTAGRCSFLTGRVPIRSALSVVTVPGDRNFLRKETPTIAEFFKKGGYSTYFSGKWHLGDRPEAYPIEHGFDEMKVFCAYYPGVYTYSDTSTWFHPWFPGYNQTFSNMYFKVVNMYEWEGVAGKPAQKKGYIDWNHLATVDVRQTDNAVEYIRKHAGDENPFFLDVNFMKMHNPNNPAPKFAGKTRLGRYSDSILELDDNIGRILDTIREVAPNTIVITTADNGAWQDAYPDAGTHPFRGDKGTPFEAGWRVPGIMWWPGHIPAGAVYHEMMTHIDCWSTLASMVGLTPPPMAPGRTTTESPSISTASTTARTSSERPVIPPAARGSTSMARRWGQCGWTLPTIRRIRISTSPGRASSPPRTPGWGPPRIPGAHPLCIASPWIPSRSVTCYSTAAWRRAFPRPRRLNGRAWTMAGPCP